MCTRPPGTEHIVTSQSNHGRRPRSKQKEGEARGEKAERGGEALKQGAKVETSLNKFKQVLKQVFKQVLKQVEKLKQV